MKKAFYFPILLLAAITVLVASCERYERVSIDIEKLGPFNDTTKIINYIAHVTGDGGCARCIEAGYCYSYFDKEPSHTCYYTTVVPVVRDAALVDSTGEYLSFIWTCQLPYIENVGNVDTTGGVAYDSTLYYFRSYIITNAGTSYSDKVDTVIVHSSY